MNHGCSSKNNKLHSNSGNHNCRQRQSLIQEEKNTKEFLVHELVAKTFVPNPNNYPYVEHIDGNRTNNRADNLKWTPDRPKGHPYRSAPI